MRAAFAVAALLLPLSGCLEFFESLGATPVEPPCAGHGHATFLVVVPGPDGALAAIDFAAPRTPGGLVYYDFGAPGGAAGFSMRIHMHQEGAESGGPGVRSMQWHMEAPGQCVTYGEALAASDLGLDGGALTLYGGHLQSGGPARHPIHAESPLGVYLDAQGADGAWAWSEVPWEAVRDMAIADGASLLILVGAASAEEVAGWQERVPPPISRAASART